ncbi:MAG: hypothetical protein KDA68_21210, partial [Planctomycetaceae bacterium]|nr:hypothetical protein [Planctomycetaceae bacterium]
MRLLRELFPNGRSEVISVCIALLLTPFVFHFMMTGSPIPLWHIQKLNGAVKVKTATYSALILEDEREIQLPFIKRIPSEDPLFVASMKEG